MRRREFLALTAPALYAAGSSHKTEVSISSEKFLINGKPTYAGRSFRGMKIEGLLMNSRVVQGIFDDRNPATRVKWKYPDTGKWDAERNTKEFLAAMPEWRAHGLLSFTINLQGGSPEGYSKAQPWITGGIAPDGSLKKDYLRRLEMILDKADSLGMVPILGIFYFGQDQNVKEEAAVKQAVRNTVEWVLAKGYRNILLEVANECNIKSYDHEIIKPPRMPELIQLAKSITKGGRRLLVGTSFGGGAVPTEAITAASDFILIHGNGVKEPKRIREMAVETRQLKAWRPMPVLFNEDDHFDFDKSDNNFIAAVESYVSWGYFDPGASDYSDGYQCPPVNWGINTLRKKGFFNLLKEMTGGL